MGLYRQTGTAGTRTKARGTLPVATRRPAALQEQQLSQEPRALAVRWRHRAVTDPRLALCCACVVPSCRPPRLRVGYVRAAPPAAEGRLTHAQCYSRLRGLLSAPLRAERERRAAHALAGSGFSRPVGSRLALRWPLGAAWWLLRAAPTSGVASTAAKRWWLGNENPSRAVGGWEAQMNYPANSKQQEGWASTELLAG